MLDVLKIATHPGIASVIVKNEITGDSFSLTYKSDDPGKGFTLNEGASEHIGTKISQAFSKLGEMYDWVDDNALQLMLILIYLRNQEAKEYFILTYIANKLLFRD